MNFIKFLSRGHIKPAEFVPSILNRLLRLIKKKIRVPYEFVEGLPISAESLNIVDIGANRGQFCEKLLISYPNAKILAIEPQVELADELVRKFNSDRLIVKQCGFGEANYRHDLNIMSESGASSFKDQHAKHSKINPHLSLISTSTVDVKKGDDVIGEVFGAENIFLVKIDVEGFEVNCLKGLSSSLSKIKFILIEISSVRADSYIHDVIEILNLLVSTHDLVSLSDIIRDEKGWIVQADYLFKRND
jgi:FkbM family methyltransferase